MHFLHYHFMRLQLYLNVLLWLVKTFFHAFVVGLVLYVFTIKKNKKKSQFTGTNWECFHFYLTWPRGSLLSCCIHWTFAICSEITKPNCPGKKCLWDSQIFIFISSWSCKKHGRHEQFLFLMDINLQTFLWNYMSKRL